MERRSQNKDLYLTDATCYESHLRFHTDVKLLCECCQWFHDSLVSKSKHRIVSTDRPKLRPIARGK